MEEDTLEELRAINLIKEANITCGCVVTNLWNCSLRAATMGLKDSVVPN